jgi:hypothetical protein
MLVSLRASDGAPVFTSNIQNYAKDVASFFQSGAPSGFQKWGLAFDGQQIWESVTVSFSGTHVNLLVKVRASDGTVQGYVHINGGSLASLSEVAFDGTNIWVGSGSDQNVIKVQASDGSVQDTIRVAGNPRALAFDGNNIWSSGESSGTVNITNGDTHTNTYFGVGSGNGSVPQGLAFDGTNMWVASYQDNIIIKMALDGSVLSTYSVGLHPRSLVFDGANIWVGNVGSSTITKLRASDGSVQGTFNVNGSPTCLVFDGANVWVGTSANTLYKL